MENAGTRLESKKIESFVNKTKELLSLERASEIEQTQTLLETLSPKELVARGLLLPKLEVVEQCTGLYGKFLVTLQPKNKAAVLKRGNRFQPGDIVGFQNEASKEIVENGVVFRVWERRIQVALRQSNSSEIFDSQIFSLVQLTNDTTYKRMERAVSSLSTCDEHLLKVFFQETPPHVVQPVDFVPFNQNLNQSQVEAISFALGSSDLALIHGPPGTGKTTTIAELIMQAVKRGERVLATAPSNIAVDNIAEKLAENKQVKMVRVGHPARFLPSVAEHCLDIVVALSNGGEVVREIRKDMDSLQKEIKSLRGIEKDKAWDSWRDLRKCLRERERKAVRDTLTGSQVVLATCSGAADKTLLNLAKFDLVVIDEAGQALEAQCWIPILKGKRVVLAGDHKQLPPTIFSEKAAKRGLEKTLFEKVIKKLGAKVSKMLVVQYRMNSKIMNWSSSALYNNKLVAHTSVENHLLLDLLGVKANEETKHPLVLIDTTGCDLMEAEDTEGSKSNEGEAQVVYHYVSQLCAAGVTVPQVAIISPYFAQVRLLRRLLRDKFPNLEINTVDGFQGREKEVVIISMVRSNDKHEVGFLKEDRRMNVAVTRAKRQCCIVCDTETVSAHPFLSKMVQYFQEHGEYLSAALFVDNTPTPEPPVLPSPPKLGHPSQKPSKLPPEPETSVMTEKEREIFHQIKKFVENPSKDMLKFNRAFSQVHAKFVEETAKKLGVFCVPYVLKNHHYVDIYRKQPEPEPKEKSDEEENSKSSENSENSENSGSDHQPELSPRTEETRIGNTTKKKNQKKKKNQTKKNPIPKKEPPEIKNDPKKDFDSKLKELDEEQALEFVIKSQKIGNCHYSFSCKELPMHLCTVCQYCKERFCVKHGIPEIHGCGEAAKKVTPPKPKKLNSTQHGHLEKKLQKKIEESAQHRTKKPKENEQAGRGRGRGSTVGRGGVGKK